MRRLVPHALYFVALVAVAAVGYLWNLQPVAEFVGTFAALCTDPLLVLLAATIGTLATRLPVLLAVSVVTGVALSLYIAYLNAPLGAELTSFVTFTRVCVVVAVALVANAARLLAIRAKPA